MNLRIFLSSAAVLLLLPATAAAQTTTPPPSQHRALALLADPETRPDGIRELQRLGSLEDPAPWIRLLAVVTRSGEAATSLAVRATRAAALERDPARGAGLIDTEVDRLPEHEQSGVLGLGAHLIEASDPARAAGLRRRLLDIDPEAVEAPEAALLLARWLVGTGTNPAEARRLLEGLIVRHPGHPLAPEARRMLGSIP